MIQLGEHTILCGFCNAPIGRRIEDDPDSEFGCAPCNNWADEDQVRKSANQFLVDQVNLILRRGIGGALGDSKVTAFKPKPFPKRHYRFIAKQKR